MLFNNVNAELGRKGWSLRMLSEKAQIPYDSLRNKMHSRTEFTRAEMMRIKRALAPEVSLDTLFAEQEEASA